MSGTPGIIGSVQTGSCTGSVQPAPGPGSGSPAAEADRARKDSLDRAKERGEREASAATEERNGADCTDGSCGRHAARDARGQAHVTGKTRARAPRRGGICTSRGTGAIKRQRLEEESRGRKGRPASH